MIKDAHLLPLDIALPAEGFHLFLGHAAPQAVLVVPVVWRRQVRVFNVNLHGLLGRIVAHMSLLFSMFGHVAQACKLVKSPIDMFTPTSASRQIAEVA